MNGSYLRLGVNTNDLAIIPNLFQKLIQIPLTSSTNGNTVLQLYMKYDDYDKLNKTVHFNHFFAI